MSKIFISYSHKDEIWKDRLQEQLEVLALEGYFSVWDDRQIEPGDDWFAEIERELNQADVAVMLISASFLRSSFIRTEEIPTLLRRRKQEGIRLIPLILRPCRWQNIEWLKAILGGYRDNVALSGLSEHQQEEALSDLAGKIHDILNPVATKSPPTTEPTIPNPTTSPSTYHPNPHHPQRPPAHRQRQILRPRTRIATARRRLAQQAKHHRRICRLGRHWQNQAPASLARPLHRR